MKKKQLQRFSMSQKVLKRIFLAGMLALPLSGSPVFAANYLSLLEQQYVLDLSFKNEKVSTILDEISRRTGIKIAYSNEQVQTEKRISVKIRTTDIKEALRIVLGENYSFQQIEDYISISKKQSNPESKQQSGKQTITGLITDTDGNPIIGATVNVKGTSNGVITDINGRYTLKGISAGDVLSFRYIGYNDEEKEVKRGVDVINIRMMESAVSLSDVVVVGYGQQKKSSVVSSLNSIGPAELNIKQRNLRNGIAGKLAGVIAIQRSGEPGNDAAAFYIRGQSSYSGGTSPLVLVDGVPRSMDDIDVDEIESFTVLKDASATAVYGAEGANGVVLITSKRGKVQKNQINFNAQYSIVTPTRMTQTVHPFDYLSLYNEAQWNDLGHPNQDYFSPETPHEILEKYRTGADRDLYPNVDWTDLLQAHTQSQRYTINFRGGSEKTRYFASAAYYSEDGIFKSSSADKYNANIGLQRFNLRSNVDMDLTKTTQLSLDMSGQYLRKNNPGFNSDEIFAAISRFPTHIIPMVYSDGTLVDHSSDGWGVDNQPYNMLNHSGYSKRWDAFLQTKVTLNQKLDFITSGLSLKGTVSFDADYGSTMKRSKTPETYFATGRSEDAELIKKQMKAGSELQNPNTSASSGSKKIYIEASFNYQRTFTEKHDVTGMLLYMQKETQYQTGEKLQSLPFRKQSVVGRATYGYDDRYMLEASMGITGSENFASGHRWGIFPAIGAAWYISHEKFMRSVTDYISKLKLRASYGITGNDNIGNNDRFPYRESIRVDANGYPLGLTPGSGGKDSNNPGAGIVEGSFSMPNLSWEKEKKLNIGVDLGLFNGRVDLSVDYFSNRRNDILIQRRTVLDVNGFRNTPFQNFGITTNKGFDGSITMKQKIGDVNLSATGNFTYAKNKILEYDEVSPRYPYMAQTGTSLGKPYLYISEGLYTPDDFDLTVDESTGIHHYTLKSGYAKPSANVSPGDIKYQDLNNDGVIDAYDQTYNHSFYSDKLPEIVYGFGLNAEWRGFFVGVFFQGTAHSSTNLIASPSSIFPFTSGKDKQSARIEALDRWQAGDPYNQQVLFPRMHTASYQHNMFASNWWYRDAGFLRLKNVEVGYDFNKKLIEKINLNNLRVYLQGTNIALWDQVKYWDPELDSGSSGAKYPICGTYTIGLEVTF